MYSTCKSHVKVDFESLVVEISGQLLFTILNQQISDLIPYLRTFVRLSYSGLNCFSILKDKIMDGNYNNDM